eukprot:CAMPEP_0116062792 /NCGR_PEP_ID=MMETSP0322-20121206/7999_1 /TAXON_ID=163516 /ORGANISM="Leptocylindrus danicus var. apora, Strain B651" /LENGTH=300 /DNA_ID=CAMNT_0003548225 /DNA_START=254 /DNA_END=1156 /DNA_ORIENTATION=-
MTTVKSSSSVNLPTRTTNLIVEGDVLQSTQLNDDFMMNDNMTDISDDFSVGSTAFSRAASYFGIGKEDSFHSEKITEKMKALSLKTAFIQREKIDGIETKQKQVFLLKKEDFNNQLENARIISKNQKELDEKSKEIDVSLPLFSDTVEIPVPIVTREGPQPQNEDPYRTMNSQQPAPQARRSLEAPMRSSLRWSRDLRSSRSLGDISVATTLTYASENETRSTIKDGESLVTFSPDGISSQIRDMYDNGAKTFEDSLVHERTSRSHVHEVAEITSIVAELKNDESYNNFDIIDFMESFED